MKFVVAYLKGYILAYSGLADVKPMTLTSPLPPTFKYRISSQSQSQSYIATDGRSISKSWCRAPSGAHDQIFIIV
jgi:hypothetical protein